MTQDVPPTGGAGPENPPVVPAAPPPPPAIPPPAVEVPPPPAGWATPASIPASARPPRRRGLLSTIVIGLVVVAGIGIAAEYLGGGGADPTPTTSSEATLRRAAEQIYRGLPEDVREQMQGEFLELVRGRFDGLTAGQIALRTADLTTSGFARLDDDRLIRRIELQVVAIDRADTAACAAFLRPSLAGQTTSLSAALTIVTKLEGDELAEWYRLALAALRAELEGSPAKRSVTDAEFDAAFAAISSRWSDDELALIQSVSDGPDAASDEDVCTVAHLIYGDLDRLSRADRAVIALYDITP